MYTCRCRSPCFCLFLLFLFCFVLFCFVLFCFLSFCFVFVFCFVFPHMALLSTAWTAKTYITGVLPDHLLQSRHFGFFYLNIQKMTFLQPRSIFSSFFKVCNYTICIYLPYRTFQLLGFNLVFFL